MHLIKFLMAEKHRKLLAAYFPSYQNINCSYFGVSRCPEPYNNYGSPEITLPSPLPPPPPPPGELNHSFITSPYFIILVSLVAGLFLLLCYYVIIVKPFAPFPRRHSGANRSTPGQSGDEFQDDNMIFHPVWLITTNGLLQSMINSITVCRYKSGEGLIEGTECSVCLSAFQENEKLRLLPKCSHAFHIPCIDTWLSSHTNCPLCRAPILSDETSSVPLGAVEQSSEDLNTNGVSFVGNVENRTIESEQNTVQDEAARVSKEVEKSTGHGDPLLEGNKMHPLRGSGSLNSRLSDSVFINMPDLYANNLLEEVQEHNSIAVAKPNSEHSRGFSRLVSFPITQYMSERALTIKRSLSCSGRFFHNQRT